MKKLFGRLAASLLALTLTTGFAAAQSKVTVAIGGGACLCYLPTVLAKQLGEYEKAGVAVELVDLKGGSDALKAVLGGSADENASIGEIVGPSFGATQVVDAVETIIDTYLHVRADGERFLDTYRRVGLKPFKEKLYAAH